MKIWTKITLLTDQEDLETKARVAYRENTSNLWDIEWYTTRKYGITSTYIKVN